MFKRWQNLIKIYEIEPQTLYRVIISQYGQYSVWPANRQPVGGWQETTVTGTSEECIAYIRQVWRPFSEQTLTMQPSSAAEAEPSLDR